MDRLAVALWVAASVSLALVALQAAAFVAHLRRRGAPLAARRGISVLKPLAGVDDGLEDNLATFAELDYPAYEVLLGVRDTTDPAYPVACRAARRWPGRMRVVLQRGEPGMNPKVNQLITLAHEAAHEWLVISDSNVRAPAGYLDEIAAALGDPGVVLVTNPVAAVGEATLGALCDNLHMTATISPNIVAGKLVARNDFALGKSMALRRADIARVGGFESVQDILAEDFVLGRRMPRELGGRMVMAHLAVTQFTATRSLGDFVRRYRRWYVMHRQAVGLFTYAGMLLLNPLPLAALACLAAPTWTAAGALAALALVKPALDGLAALAVRPLTLRELAAVPMKDALIFTAWWYGLLFDEVDWRGHRVEVLPGTVVRRPEALDVAAPVSQEEDAALAALARR